MPDCRSAVIIGLGFAVLLVLARCLPQLFAAKPVQALLCLAAPLVAAFTWALSLVYDKDNKLMAAIDFVLSRRISLAYNTFGMEKLYGNQHFFFGQAFIPDGFYRVDNSYIYYYYLCGPIMVALICLGFVLLTYRLLKQGVKALVVACNTATSSAIVLLRQTHPELPIIGIEPAVKPAAQGGSGSAVLVMATPLTIRAKSFMVSSPYIYTAKYIQQIISIGRSRPREKTAPARRGRRASRSRARTSRS